MVSMNRARIARRRTSIGRLLDRVAARGLGEEEGVVGQAEEQAGLLHDLVDRVLDRGSARAGDRIQVDADDSDTIGELLDILARRVERVKVVKVGQGAEELARAAHLVADDETAFAAAFDLEYLVYS